MSLETWQRLSPQRSARLDAAVDCYLRRQAHRINPEGYFDNAGRWRLAETEKQVCCDSICKPGRAYRHLLNKHCRSMEHIAHLFDVDLHFLRRHVKFRIRFLQELREGYRQTSRLLAEIMARQADEIAEVPAELSQSELQMQLPGFAAPDLSSQPIESSRRVGSHRGDSLIDRPGGKSPKPPARLPFERKPIVQAESDDLTQLLKEIEGLI